MDHLYNIGPALIAAISALAIAAYAWHRLPLVSIVTVLWAAGAIIVGRYAFFSAGPDWQSSDRLGFLLFGTLAFTPAALLLLAARHVAPFSDFLAQTPTSALVITQVYRFGGIFLLIAFLRGTLPAQIGLVSGLLDIIIAATAVMLAVSLRSNGTRAPGLVVAWALLALFDFVWAVAVVTMSFLQLLTVRPHPLAMGNPPLVVISLFALPLGLFVAVHLLTRMRGLRA